MISQNFNMKCEECGEPTGVTMSITEGKEIIVDNPIAAPSTMCICGAIQRIPLGKYKVINNEVVRTSDVD